MRCRYDCSGRWLKGCVHLHTTVSDGQQTVEEVAKAYADEGYDFIAVTDHDIPSRLGDVKDAPLLLLDGTELAGTAEGAAYHALCLGTFDDFPEDQEFHDKLDTCKAQGGIVVLAHPHLMWNTPEEAMAYEYDGVEIFNALGELFCKNDNMPHWDRMMGREKADVLAFAVDDAHRCGPPPPGEPDSAVWKLGWIMVNSREATRESVFEAIKVGNFYASTGPSFESIAITDAGRIEVKTSPVRRVWVMGGYWQVLCKGLPPDGLFTDADFEVPDWDHLRIVIEDEHGRRAWSNNILAT